MANKLYIDFETYSEVDIKKHGGKRYAEDQSTQVLCLGYAFDAEPVELWTPDKPFPRSICDHVAAEKPVYAHNITFDWRVWNEVLVRDFDIDMLSLKQCVDTMALCNTYTLPGSLAFAGAALDLTLPKLESGVRLINKCCKPNKLGKQPMPWDDPETFKELFLYCKRDVEAMREIVQKLPRETLLPIEQEIWLLSTSMNDTGLPVDTEAVHAILNYLTKYVKDTMSAVSTITGGACQTVNQIAKIKDWCLEHGVDLPNMQAETITEILAQEDLHEGVRSLLKLRQELGRTSTAKFKKVAELEYHDWVYDNLQYHGTSTGRWAGRGFQMHNLPRAFVKHPKVTKDTPKAEATRLNAKYTEKRITDFIEGRRVPDPVTVGKGLIRSIIKAPEGYTIMCSDYSSIENRVLAWLAGDEVTLQGFRDGFDQYADMAAHLYQIPLEEVSADQRQFGKVIILGAGYMMGVDRFLEVAKDWGIFLSLHEAKHAIDTYREKYYLIKRLWHRLNQAAREAVLTGKTQTYLKITFGTATVKGIRWLAMRLPSGKSVYYMNPAVENKHIPGYEHMGKVPTITHSGVNPYSKKWSRLSLSPGRIAENATQATAREAMAYGMLNVQKELPECQLIFSVHDEIGGLIPEELAIPAYLEDFNLCMCDIPWAPDCPLQAEGYFSKRYKKG